MNMQDASGPNATAHPAIEDYRRLLGKKRALEQVVRIAESVEQLNSGLQGVVLMGRPSADLHRNVLRYFERLDETVRVLPTQKIRATLQRLEQRIKGSIREIMALAEGGAGISEESSLSEPTASALNEFRRTAQTAVALRIVLRERGEPTRATALPVDPELLRRRVDEVSEQEKACRNRVMGDIKGMQRDLQAILTTSDMPEVMKTLARCTLEELQQNLRHLEAGGSIEKLPHSLEMVEMAEELPVTPPEPSEPQPPPHPPAPLTNSPKRGFLDRLELWLNSPWSVSWKDTRKKGKEKE